MGYTFSEDERLWPRGVACTSKLGLPLTPARNVSLNFSVSLSACGSIAIASAQLSLRLVPCDRFVGGYPNSAVG
jgi:hypothetical protein